MNRGKEAANGLRPTAVVFDELYGIDTSNFIFPEISCESSVNPEVYYGTCDPYIIDEMGQWEYNTQEKHVLGKGSHK